VRAILGTCGETKVARQGQGHKEEAGQGWFKQKVWEIFVTP